MYLVMFLASYLVSFCLGSLLVAYSRLYDKREVLILVVDQFFSDLVVIFL